LDFQAFSRTLGSAVAAHGALARQLVAPPLRLPVTNESGTLPVLFFSQVAWDTVWQRPQELALGLARHRPVVFVSPIQVHEAATRLRGRWKPVRRLRHGNLTVLTPVILSGEYRSPAVRRTNRQILLNLLRRVATRWPRYLFLTNTPFAMPLAEALRPALLAYDIIDDFAAFNWAPPEGRGQEDDLLAAADLVVAGTGFLRDRYASIRPEIEFLPSGVKLSSLLRPAKEPDDLANLPHPRLLYVGTLNDRVDGKLFSLAADAAKNGSVVVVGPRHGAFQPGPDRPSVHFLGLKPHSDLAGYYQHCDLGIMPFADNEAARAINPVKTLEFLACGLPVVSTPIPDVCRYYPDVVRVAEPADWRRAIGEELEGDAPELRAKRKNFAKGRGWANLVRAFEAKIAALEGNA
jgi:glycosyltransferase involved in cell wall biosynthesis